MTVESAKDDFINLPATSREQDIIAEDFLHKTGFPGVVWSLDGTYIPIPWSRQNQPDYINRKNFPSVILQGICNLD